MKPFLLLIGISISIFIAGSCKKSGVNDAPPLPGAWELRYQQGGYTLNTQTGNFPPGNGHIYKFTETTYSYYAAGQRLDSGQYRITKDTISPFQKNMDKLTFTSSSTTRSVFFEFSNNNLVIYNGIIAADGTIATYSKL
ncbi:MAG TPA: hypothetical protein VL832_27700 [Puia sp.]|jgi:hypothetical protein|nr:hypothetical protein [Puia sp.]